MGFLGAVLQKNDDDIEHAGQHSVDRNMNRLGSVSSKTPPRQTTAASDSNADHSQETSENNCIGSKVPVQRVSLQGGVSHERRFQRCDRADFTSLFVRGSIGKSPRLETYECVVMIDRALLGRIVHRWSSKMPSRTSINSRRKSPVPRRAIAADYVHSSR
jgi:hypothetical protein